MSEGDLLGKIYDLENKLITLESKYNDLMYMFYELEGQVGMIEMNMEPFTEATEFLNKVKNGLDAGIQ